MTRGLSFGQLARVVCSHWIWSRPTPPHPPRPRPHHGAVQGRHVPRLLLAGHLLCRPIVAAATYRVEPDEPNPLVIEGPGRRPEEADPLGPHVEVPIVLARDEHLLDGHV